MTIDPFELHPDIGDDKEKNKKEKLTKQEIFDILNEMIERVENAPPKTWGYEREDILVVLEEVVELIGEK